jgi:hypothetical protein
MQVVEVVALALALAEVSYSCILLFLTGRPAA